MRVIQPLPEKSYFLSMIFTRNNASDFYSYKQDVIDLVIRPLPVKIEF